MIKRIVLAVVTIGLVVGAVIGYYAYRMLYGPALDLEDERVAFYVKSDWDQKDVLNSLSEATGLRHPDFAERLMEKKNYRGDLVVSGKYTLTSDMGLNELIDHLRAGNGEEEVQVTFNSARKLSELAAKVSVNIEADSAQIAEKLSDPALASKYGFNSATFISMFFPDTYRMEWDTDADEFVGRMAEEYKRFWTAERVQKARNYGLSQSEVSTLASIVQAEQQVHPDERKVIAGLYLNRLRKGMRLQSDPTVVYAVGDFSINRVLTKHLSTPSPYNTYIHAGLPPGPINIPSKQSIDAVLNADENRYLFMCAKADFSGYHAFATNLSEHNRNAKAFQKALNDRNIYK
ncbi:MAG TPA: endolytic transglycosylase MltG [Cryomorphaceae bacterium]|nr:endolytic transglycosylase MltG [Cryomorphaceae bacterium]